MLVMHHHVRQVNHSASLQRRSDPQRTVPQRFRWSICVDVAGVVAGASMHMHASQKLDLTIAMCIESAHSLTWVG
jgi:hypothetical protein